MDCTIIKDNQDITIVCDELRKNPNEYIETTLKTICEKLKPNTTLEGEIIINPFYTIHDDFLYFTFVVRDYVDLLKNKTKFNQRLSLKRLNLNSKIIQINF